MMNVPVVTETQLSIPLFIKGKVRDTYSLGEYLLIVATDRISAFDVVLPNGIPNKGAVLNQVSGFWFGQTSGIIRNHLIEMIISSKQLDYYIPAAEKDKYGSLLIGRSMIVKKVKRLPVECVVRGYITGSAMTEYQKSKTISGITLPAGLRESEKLVEPIFTPTTKAESGHDMPLTMPEVEKLIGKKFAGEIRNKSIEIYKYAAEYALNKGIIIADTKMEYGIDENDELVLIDELLTPDSSRFWDVSLYKVGQSQPSFDKQPVRDWLANSGWNKEPPAPPLPSDVVKSTSERYVTAFERLTGNKLKL